MTGLTRYDRACRAIADAKAVDEVKDLRDRADALRTYARQAKNKQLEVDASEIRFRAERRIGTLMDEQRETVGLARGAAEPNAGSSETRVKPTLADAGIDKNLADRARKYAAVSDDAFEQALAGRRVLIERENARVTVNLFQEADKAARRAEREATLGQKIRALPDERYGFVYDDPEWRYEVWSRETGLDRAADNHYPTSALDDILARDIPSIAAPDCAWARWVTVPFLAHGIRSIEVGGFEYKTSWCWDKVHCGTGYWNRNRHEILLFAVRGDVPCPAPGGQWASLFSETRTEHSAKPEWFLDMFDAYFPNVPKIELNRRGPARPGWAAWGNEAEGDDADRDDGRAEARAIAKKDARSAPKSLSSAEQP